MAKSDTENIQAAGDLLIPARRRRGMTVAPSDAFSEVGTTGLRQYGGFVLEEWLNQLAGRRAAWVYREMMDNDPTIGAIMFAIRWLARGVDYRVEEGNQPEAAELVESCMDDMSHSWGDFVSEALSMLGYGWAFHETVYKRRQGPQAPRIASLNPGAEAAQTGASTSETDDTPAGSKYNDGRVGWRKLPIRAQETLLNWDFDGYSGLKGMHQVDWHGGDHHIPIEKAVLFRTQTTRGNPEGRSILRNAYTSYFALKNIKQIEAIGIERDLAGVPVAKAPPDVDIFSAGQQALYNKVKAMVTGLRQDEYSGIVLPSGWELELLNAAGGQRIDTDKVVRRYRQDIATSMLADFVLIGQDAVGSFAMVDVKSDLFGIAIDGVLDLLCEVINQYAIPRLLALNGFDITEPPRITHGSAGRIDLEKVGNFLFQLAGSGAPIPWNKALLTSLFREAALPANFDEDAQEHVPVVPEPSEDAAGGDLEPVGPPKLPPGNDQPFAREAHMAAAGDEPAAAKQPPAPVKKAERTRVRGGTAIDVSTRLRERHAVLSAQLEQDINTALAALGQHAATAYSQVAHKASAGMLHRIVARVLQAIGLNRWTETYLKPVVKNHAARVIADTQRTLQTEINLEVKVADDAAQRIIDTAGSGLGMRDIEPQIRQSIMDAIRKGLDAGESPAKTADRIRQDVPAGRFVNAGARYRARLIARDQTSKLQRAATLASYQSNPRITSIRLRDGIFGPPRSDENCIERDGDTVAIGDADTVHAEHPQCTLSFDPVVSGVLPELPELEPALAA